MNSDNQKAKNIALVVYILQALSFFTVITAVIALIINYIKKDDVQNTWVSSHFKWQIRTFWFGLLWTFVGLITSMIGIGYFILIANAVWVIYRIIKGWLNLNDDKPMYQN